MNKKNLILYCAFLFLNTAVSINRAHQQSVLDEYANQKNQLSNEEQLAQRAVYNQEIGEPFVKQFDACPSTNAYIKAPKNNIICAKIFTSLGNLGLFLNKLTSFAWMTNSFLIFDTRNWRVLPEILHRSKINPWLNVNCANYPPPQNNWSTVFLMDGSGWMMLSHNTTAKLANIAIGGNIRTFVKGITAPITNEPTKCKFNALFSRSHLIVSALLKLGHFGRPYTALHIRTMTEIDKTHFGCTNRSNPICSHIISGTSTSICRKWLSNTQHYGHRFLNDLNQFTVLVTASENIKRVCLKMSNNTLMVIGHKNSSSVHTFRGEKDAAVAAFTDFFMLTDSKVLICGRSSYCIFARILAYNPHDCKKIEGGTACAVTKKKLI